MYALNLSLVLLVVGTVTASGKSRSPHSASSRPGSELAAVIHEKAKV